MSFRICMVLYYQYKSKNKQSKYLFTYYKKKMQIQQQQVQTPTPINEVKPPALKVKKFHSLKELEAFTSNLQKGDLALSKLINYGFVLVGQTKTGKTSTGHLLSGNKLRGTMTNDGEQIVINTTQNYVDAVIGNDFNSQTMIPNFFQVTLPNENYRGNSTYVIDTPGYGDTLGVLRILANGYFHYRVYQKVQNMKFIICVDQIHLKNTASGFIDTLCQFTSYFKNFFQNKINIWKSCTLLVTKVNNQSEKTFTFLKNRLEAIAQNLKTQLPLQEEEEIKQMIRFMVQNQRIFFNRKFRQDQEADCQQLLQRIDKKISDWWTRSLNTEKNIVNMEPIKFSLAKQIIISITRQQKSKQQLVQLIEYYNIQANKFVSLQNNENNLSLSQVLDAFVRDTMGTPDSDEFLVPMQKYNKENYEKYDRKLIQKRTLRQKQLLSLQDSQTMINHKLNDHYRDSFERTITKFEILERIQDLKSEIHSRPFTRTIEWLQSCEKNLYSIIKEFTKLFIGQPKQQQIIHKYNYIIYRIIQDAKVFFRLIQIFSTNEERQQIIKLAGLTSGFFDLWRPLVDFMGVSFRFKENDSCTHKSLKQYFINNYQIDDKILQQMKINQPLINFFTENILQDQQTVFPSSTKMKISKLLLKFSDQALDSSSNQFLTEQKDTIELIKKIMLERMSCEKIYHDNATNDSDKDEALYLIRRLTKNMGEFLLKIKKQNFAMSVYQSINLVRAVSDIYQKQIYHADNIKELKFSQKKAVSLRIEYSDYLFEHNLQHEAFSVLHDVQLIADSVQDLKKVANKIIETRKQYISKQTSQYHTKLQSGVYFQKFSEELVNQINSL